MPEELFISSIDHSTAKGTEVPSSAHRDIGPISKKYWISLA